MKVLFLLEYYEPHVGGVETLFKSLAGQLVKRGYKVTVLTNKYDSSLKSKEIIEGVEVIRYRFFNRYLFTFLAWIPGLWQASGVKVIHTTSYNAGLPAWIVGLLRRKKTIITFHEYWGNLWFELPWLNILSRYLNSAFERLLGSLPFHRFIAVSDYTKFALLDAGVPESKLIRIYNGIDYDDFVGVEGSKNPEEFQFLFFGRVGYSKGIDLLVRAIPLIETFINFRVKLILPKEPLLEKVKTLINERGLSKDLLTIESSKPFSELKKSIKSSNCILIPSYSEGFCYAAVETMAIGTPIVSSGRGALSEVVSGQFITMDSYTPAGLARAMQSALKEEWNNTEMKQFLLQETIEQYIELYHELDQ